MSTADFAVPVPEETPAEVATTAPVSSDVRDSGGRQGRGDSNPPENPAPAPASKTCERCGTQLVRKPYEYPARFARRRFCSRECVLTSKRRTPEDRTRQVAPFLRLPISDDEDLSWQQYANCLGVDPDLFFPERGASTREAKEVCRGCVVRDACLEYAIVHAEKFGIWGGLSERERRRIRRERALRGFKRAAS